MTHTENNTKTPDLNIIIAELSYHKLEFNKNITNISYQLSLLLSINKYLRIDPNDPINVHADNAYEYNIEVVYRINETYTLANAFLLNFAHCLHKLYPCNQSALKSLSIMVRKLYSIYLFDDMQTLLNTIVSIGSSLIPFTREITSIILTNNTTNLLNSVANNIYDMIMFTFATINSLPNEYNKKCKLVKCVLNNMKLFMSGLLFGIDYTILSNRELLSSYTVNEFFNVDAKVITNRELYLVLRTFYSRAIEGVKLLCEKDKCEAIRLLYVLYTYVIKVILAKGPIPIRTHIDAVRIYAESTSENLVPIEVDLFDMKKIMSQIIAILPNPCVRREKELFPCNDDIIVIEDRRVDERCAVGKCADKSNDRSNNDCDEKVDEHRVTFTGKVDYSGNNDEFCVERCDDLKYKDCDDNVSITGDDLELEEDHKFDFPQENLQNLKFKSSTSLDNLSVCEEDVVLVNDYEKHDGIKLNYMERNCNSVGPCDVKVCRSLSLDSIKVCESPKCDDEDVVVNVDKIKVVKIEENNCEPKKESKNKNKKKKNKSKCHQN